MEYDDLISLRDDAKYAYEITGNLYTKGNYNRYVKMLRQYLAANNLTLEEQFIDPIAYEESLISREKGSAVDISDVDDSGDRVQEYVDYTEG